ncbi:MAG: RidA family protein [Candidatus Obscuribacterales bacterium]|jgi:enamine deaminase RidA (YjgF/YER057c/UK114 family)
MKRLLVSSGSPYEEPIGFSRAVRVGNLIAVAGTAPVGADGITAHPGDAYGQTLRCLEIIAAAIEEAGGKLENVVRTRMFLTRSEIWQDVGKAHGEYFGKIRPASTMLVVNSLLSPEWLVEIEADCIVPD